MVRLESQKYAKDMMKQERQSKMYGILQVSKDKVQKQRSCFAHPEPLVCVLVRVRQPGVGSRRHPVSCEFVI